MGVWISDDRESCFSTIIDSEFLNTERIDKTVDKSIRNDFEQ